MQRDYKQAWVGIIGDANFERTEDHGYNGNTCEPPSGILSLLDILVEVQILYCSTTFCGLHQRSALITFVPLLEY